MSDYDDFCENEIINGTKKEELDVNQFVIGDQKHKNTQQLFLYVLKSFIEKYNNLSEEKIKEEGIFYLEDEKVLLGSITEELVQNYKTYKELFNGLMTGNSGLFREYDPILDNDNYKALSETKYKKRIYYYNYWFVDSCKKFYENKTVISAEMLDFNIYYNKIKKIEYDLNHFAFYFNGMYFEHIATETLFKLISDNCDKEYINKNNNKIISLLPRIMFYMKNADSTKITSSGFNEIDCAFILKEKVEIEKEKITCLNKFSEKKDTKFYNVHNFSNLIIEKDNVVIIEVKSHWETIVGKKGNILIQFIDKAMKFVDYYRRLNLITEEQKVVLIYLYNNSIYYDLHTENDGVLCAYEYLRNYYKGSQLYISYFQPYLKLMNAYERANKLRELNDKLEMLQEGQINLLNKLEEKDKEIEKMKNNYAQQFNKAIEEMKNNYAQQFNKEIEKMRNDYDKKFKEMEEKIQNQNNNQNRKKNSLTSNETLETKASSIK